MDIDVPNEFLNLPFEVQENVLDCLVDSTDVLHVALASRQCYDLALPVLYRNLDWTVGKTHHGKASKRSMNYVLDRPDLIRAVRTLRMSEKRTSPEWDTCIPWNWSAAREDPEMIQDFTPRHEGLFNFHEPNINRFHIVHPPRHERDIPADIILDDDRDLAILPFFRPQLLQGMPMPVMQQPARPQQDVSQHQNHTLQRTNVMARAISSFIHLSELTLRSITLPSKLFEIIHSISPTLRTLTIRSCHPSSNYPAHLDPSTLNITELTLLNIGSGTQNHSRRFESILSLARSSRLRTLRMDRSLENSFDFLVHSGIPQTLRTLICDFRFLYYRTGRGTGTSLFAFLNACRSVTDLSITDLDVGNRPSEISSRLQNLDHALPNLTTLTAPLVLVRVFAGRRPLRSLTICDTSNVNPPFLVKAKIPDIELHLKGIETGPVSLEHLALNVKEWDKELMYMLRVMVPQVKELTVVYRQGEVDDDFYMTLGNIIEVPHLERFHLYKYGDRMKDASEEAFETHKEYMIIWQRYMPNLFEVALTSDIMWFKCKKTRTWSRREIQPLDGVKGLLTF